MNQANEQDYILVNNLTEIRMNKLIDLHFIQMDKLIGYLNNKLILYPKLICEFTKLDEQQMASYIFPSYVSNEKKKNIE